MSNESLLALIHHPYHPPLFFCVGFLTAMICCLVAMVVESRFRRRETNPADIVSRPLTYQRFHNELVSSPRHLGFAAGEVYELDHQDFMTGSE